MERFRNLFCRIALKPDGADDLWPWLHRDGEQISFNKACAREHFRVREAG